MAKKKRIAEERKSRRVEKPLAQHNDRPTNGDAIAQAGVSRYQGLLLSLLIVAGFLVYLNTLSSPFVFDDSATIIKNRFVRATELSARSIADAAFGGHARNRPVPMVSFALNYYLGQYNAVGYHLVNIILHIINGVLLFFFLKITLGLSRQKQPETFAVDRFLAVWIPFFAALIWLVHPLQTQSVTYIVQRMNSMAATFSLLSFLLYVKGRLLKLETGNFQPATRPIRSKIQNPRSKTNKRYFWFSASVLGWIVALGCKESVATLPFLIFLYEWFFFQDLNKHWLKAHLKWLFLIVTLFAISALIYLGADPWAKISNLRDFSDAQFTIGERLLTQARVVMYYLSLILYPHPARLNLDYDFPISHSLFDPVTTVLCFFVIGGLIGLAIYLAKKDRLLSFCILWFFGNLVIESSVIPLAIIFEHRTYLPSMLIILMAVIIVFRHVRKKALAVGSLCVAGLVFSFWAYERNTVWSDEVTLWSDCVEKSPQKARPQTNLGFALAQQGHSAEAIGHYVEALRLKPDFAEAHNNLGLALEDQGKLAEAISHYGEALRLRPGFAEAHNNLGNALLSQGNPEEAAQHFSEALRLDPDSGEARNNLGNVLLRQGKLKEAFRWYREALRLQPRSAETHYNLGVVLLREQNIEGAISQFSEALKIKPDYGQAHSDLGIALARQEKLSEANHHLLEAVRIAPNSAEAHFNLAVALVNQEKMAEATRHFAEAVRIKPDYAEAYYNLANALLRQGKLHKAMESYREALRYKPDFVEAHCNLGAVFLSQGNFSEAIAHYSAALKIRPEFAEAHYNLGSAFLGQGSVAEAIHHYREALRIDPAHQGAKERLEALSSEAVKAEPVPGMRNLSKQGVSTSTIR